MGFSGGSVVKPPPANAGDVNLIPGSRRFPGGGNDNPLQYSCLENFMDRGPWWAIAHGSQRVGQNLEMEHACAQSLAEICKDEYATKTYMPHKS